MERFNKSKGGARAPGYTGKETFCRKWSQEEKKKWKLKWSQEDSRCWRLQQPEGRKQPQHQQPPCQATHVLQCPFQIDLVCNADLYVSSLQPPAAPPVCAAPLGERVLPATPSCNPWQRQGGNLLETPGPCLSSFTGAFCSALGRPWLTQRWAAEGQLRRRHL